MHFAGAVSRFELGINADVQNILSLFIAFRGLECGLRWYVEPVALSVDIL